MMNSVDFLSGIGMATFAASGVFFLKFWLASRDTFYLFFSLTCWLLSLERLILFFIKLNHESLRTPITEANSWVYMMRLFAFALLFLAIIKKNRQN